VVIGAGPNGLVAANVLADAGWQVTVLEANDSPGGAVRTAEVTAPGFRNDLFSAFFPFTAASPVIARLDLGHFGLRWTHAPAVLAHPLVGRPAAVLHRTIDDTVEALAVHHRGDANMFREIYTQWTAVADPLIASLLSPFPPIRAGARLARAAGVDGLRELARLALIPLRRFVEETFDADAAALLLAGSALHADLTLDTAGSALFGWLLVCLGQQFGFPVPVGGAGGITDALVRRSLARGIDIQCGRRVDRVLVTDGRARGVQIIDGDRVEARHAVLADCDARALYIDLIGADELPPRFVARLARVQRSSATFKVDWALGDRIPWLDPAVAGAGTVHVADSLEELSVTSMQLSTSTVPDRPFLLVGQMSTADPTRSPPGTESAWAYTHVPAHVSADAGGEVRGTWDRNDCERFATRMEQRIEIHAPGFRNRIIARHVMAPPDLARRNANLVNGDISGGTAQLHQQAIFRPVPGWARPETPIRRLYLASASAHPGGAVHGACGANAARAAILGRRLRR